MRFYDTIFSLELRGMIYMKKNILLVMTLTSLLLTACHSGQKTSEPSEQPSTSEEEIKNYAIKDVNVYKEANKVDRKVSLRFYNDHPHVPYINVSSYYHEFFNVDYTYTLENGLYTYLSRETGYLRFDTDHNYFASLDIGDFSYLPASVAESSKVFVNYKEVITTPKREKIIDLNAYHIDIYSDVDGVYTPLTFLSDFSGGNELYNVAYNGEDIYIIDFDGMTTDGEKRDTNYYRDTYYKVLGDFDTPREDDLIEYVYNELCLIFDNYRGYTSHLFMGDNNLLSLGLDGVLTQYYPKVKQYLLSKDKDEYLLGYFALFVTLFDGGHTSQLLEDVPNDLDSEEDFASACISKASSDQDISNLCFDFLSEISAIIMKTAILKSARNDAFKIEANDNGFYYRFDEDSKTAYIGFDHFTCDFQGWDDFYNSKGDIPLNSDTYAYVRNQLYQALDDKAENVVLDLSTNIGGNSASLDGIYGLLCGAKGEFSMNNTLYRYRYTTPYEVDINLDGKFDELDVEEAGKFDFNYGILTSNISYSCGNLLPSLLKEAGYKIIGQKSGGGSCSIHLGTTGDGLPFSRSSYLCLSNASGDNLDDGVPLDLDIIVDSGKVSIYSAISYFYDFNYVGNYLSNAYKK